MIRNRVDLAKLRKAKDLSQQELASLAGVSQATISRLEQNEHDPSLQMLGKLARALEVDLRELLEESTLNQLLGQENQEDFYAFCPNPLCTSNKISRSEGTNRVAWTSGKNYPTDRYNEINFCTRCGTDLAKECPGCGRRLENEGTRYCITCGTQITDRPTDEEWDEIGRLVDPNHDIPF